MGRASRPPAPTCVAEPQALPQEPTERSIRFAIAGLGVVGIGTGFGVGFASFAEAVEGWNESEELNKRLFQIRGTNPCSNPATFQGPCQEIKDKNNTTKILLGIGIGTTAVGLLSTVLVIYEFVRPSTTSSPARPQVALHPLPGGGAITMIGAF